MDFTDHTEHTAATSGLLRPQETLRSTGLQREFPVSTPLQPYVERYWTVRWDRYGQPPFRSEVLPHPAVNLSVESGNGRRHGHLLPAALVHGVVTRRFTIDLVGAGRVCAVKFRPGGFTALTGLRIRPDSVCRAETVLDGTVLDDTWATIGEAVLAEPDDERRTALLDEALRPFAREPEPAYLHLLGILAEMIADRDLTRVDQVAERAGTTQRSLQRSFHHYLGVGPKWVLRRYRLQTAAALIDAGTCGDLADLAAGLGWFDQAHFTRDFRAVIGVTPSAYAARGARFRAGEPPSPTASPAR